MKFKIIDNEQLQFYNSAGELTGTIQISSSGDMFIRPESGSSRDITIGDPDVAGDIEVGLVSAPVNFTMLGGGTITSNGNTLNIGSAANGDTVNLYNVIYSQSLAVTGSVNVTGSVTATSFVGDGSGLTNLPSSGGGGIFHQTGSYFATTNDLQITGSLTISGSFVDFTNATAISGSTFSGSFQGDGSALTNLPGGGIFHQTGSYYATTNDLHVTGSLLVTGSLNIFASTNIESGSITLDASTDTTSPGSNTKVNIGAGSSTSVRALKVHTNSGTLEIGPQNGSYSHFYTSVANFYFNKPIHVNGTIYSYGGDMVLGRNSGVTDKITIGDQSIDLTLNSTNILSISQTATSILNSNLIISSSTPAAATSSLSVYGSGSTVFDIIGSEGTLFAVDDDLEGTLFTANDKTGLPVIEASSSGELYFGKSPQSLYTTAVISSNTANITQSIYGIETGSFEGGFFEYTAFSGSDLNKSARAGNIMAIWSGSTVNFTETTTTDFGDTSNLLMQVQISQSQAQLQSYSTTPGYKIKAIIRSI